MTEPYQSWLGRTQSAADTVGLGPARAVMALLDRAPELVSLGDPLPPCWHWFYFHQPVRRSDIGADGHPRRGGWVPPIPLARRMWAGSRLRFLTPLRIGQAAERRSEINAIEEKQGRSGTLVFVTVRHLVTGPDGPAVEEEQDLVFRDPPPGPPARPADPIPAERDWEETFRPNAATLFRFSALTMNGHRIHYDYPYATEVEKYRGLLVHAPLTALLLVDAAGRRNAARVATYRFQALSPLFNDEPVALFGRTDPATGDSAVWAGDPSGRIAVAGGIGWLP